MCSGIGARDKGEIQCGRYSICRAHAATPLARPP